MQAAGAQAPSGVDSSLVRVRQTFSIESRVRRYRVGPFDVHENTAPISYTLATDRLRVRISGEPLAFSTDDASIRGGLPVMGRLDVRAGADDSVRVYGQTASFPGRLTSAQTVAIGSVGTSVLDLSGIALGTQPLAGVRGVLGLPLGDLGVSIRGAAEYEPRPAGSDTVYWRGTTVRAGVALAGNLGEDGTARFVGAVDVTRSFADSLGGRNLFAGGGTVIATGRLVGPIGSEERGAEGEIALFVLHPYSVARSSQANRLIPAGNFVGVSSTLALTIGDVLLLPQLTLARESSTVPPKRLPFVPGQQDAAWTAAAGVAASVSLSPRLSLTPEIGGTTGSSVLQFTGPRGGVLAGSSDAIRGWWAALELAITM